MRDPPQLHSTETSASTARQHAQVGIPRRTSDASYVLLSTRWIGCSATTPEQAIRNMLSNPNPVPDFEMFELGGTF